MPPKITAIISTYKSARLLPSRLDNLLNQTIADQLEIIVIDSGSPQNEGEIVSQYRSRSKTGSSSKEERLQTGEAPLAFESQTNSCCGDALNGIRYLRTEHETLYAAWNRAVELAEGEYLISANTDDRLHPEACEKLANLLDRDHDIALAYSDLFETEDEFDILNFVDLSPAPNWRLIQASEFSHKELLIRCYVGAFPMWRRSVHERWGLFDPEFKVAGDHEYWLRIAEHCRFRRVPEPLGLVLVSCDGICARNQTAWFKEMATIRRKYFGLRSSFETSRAYV